MEYQRFITVSWFGRPPRVARCSFCKKPWSATRKLVGGPPGRILGPRVFICSDCVDRCQRALQAGSSSPPLEIP